MRIPVRSAAAALVALLLPACAGLLRPPAEPDPLEPQHPLQVHERMWEEALRLHWQAHEAAREAAERARAALPETPPPPVDTVPRRGG